MHARQGRARQRGAAAGAPAPRPTAASRRTSAPPATARRRTRGPGRAAAPAAAPQCARWPGCRCRREPEGSRRAAAAGGADEGRRSQHARLLAARCACPHQVRAAAGRLASRSVVTHQAGPPHGSRAHRHARVPRAPALHQGRREPARLLRGRVRCKRLGPARVAPASPAPLEAPALPRLGPLRTALRVLEPPSTHPPLTLATYPLAHPPAAQSAAGCRRRPPGLRARCCRSAAAPRPACPVAAQPLPTTWRRPVRRRQTRHWGDVWQQGYV